MEAQVTTKQRATPAAPPLLFVYAKAVVGYLVALAGSITGWALAVGPGPIDRTGWIGLGTAIVTPAAAALGIAVTTNADAPEGA
jgi:hypothetical protein